MDERFAMTWVTFAVLGAVLGLAALAGLVWALRAPRKPLAALAFVLLGLAGLGLAGQATALDTAINGQPVPEGLEGEDLEIDDFDAPLDDDF
ncbi:MAG: hypothetical protein AAF447_17265 [Myxococcota bacterium]